MVKHFDYETSPFVCSHSIHFDIEDGILHNVEFVRGCNGNTHGIMSLVEGMEATEVVKRLKGIRCQGATSCPNELAKAIELCLAEIEKESAKANV